MEVSGQLHAPAALPPGKEPVASRYTDYSIPAPPGLYFKVLVKTIPIDLNFAATLLTNLLINFIIFLI
jgi:hypothetical protein